MSARARPARSRSSRGASVHVALLRGINVGGNNQLPMKELAAMFVEAGCTEVQTYIQSGNVVFSASGSQVERIAGLVDRSIADRFGFSVPLVTRSADELEAVARDNPFVQSGADPKRLHVAFLAEQPDAARVAMLDPQRSPPDELVVRGREIYLHCPRGIGRSKLTNAYFDSRLATTSTIRNWNTVRKLVALAGR